MVKKLVKKLVKKVIPSIPYDAHGSWSISGEHAQTEVFPTKFVHLD